MDDINKIEIFINCLDFSRMIIIENNKLYINGISKNITIDKCNELFNIIMLWDREYFDDTYLDAEEYKIKIFQDNFITQYNGCGKYPDNYDEFREWVKSLYE